MKPASFLCALLIAIHGARLSAQTAPAPTPPVVEACCILFQVMQKLEESVAAHELSAVHNEDMTLNVAVTTLLKESAAVPPEKKDALQIALVLFGRKVADLHTAADAFDQAKAETELKTVVSAFAEITAFYGDDVLRPARALADRYTCPMHADVIGKKGDPCPKCGMPLDQLIRPALFRPGSVLMPAKTIRANASIDQPLEVGRKVNATLHLRRIFGNEPVLLTDLREVHTQKIHLLLIDSSLTDYHHEHPVPTQTPGDYAFSFTPHQPGSYRVWADLRTVATGFQEYAQTDISSPVPGEQLSDKTVKLHAEVDGLRYDLSFAAPEIKAGQPVAGKLRITKNDGTPFTALEPIMATFAHLVGFSEDYKTILHLHPKGPPLLDASARGGPDLEFQFYATQPGFIRLFAQVQIGGESKFAPFGLEVQP